MAQANFKDSLVNPEQILGLLTSALAASPDVWTCSAIRPMTGRTCTVRPDIRTCSRCIRQSPSICSRFTEKSLAYAIAYKIAYLTLNNFQSHSRVPVQSPVQNCLCRRHVSPGRLEYVRLAVVSGWRFRKTKQNSHASILNNDRAQELRRWILMEIINPLSAIDANWRHENCWWYHFLENLASAKPCAA